MLEETRIDPARGSVRGTRRPCRAGELPGRAAGAAARRAHPPPGRLRLRPARRRHRRRGRGRPRRAPPGPRPARAALDRAFDRRAGETSPSWEDVDPRSLVAAWSPASSDDPRLRAARRAVPPARSRPTAVDQRVAPLRDLGRAARVLRAVGRPRRPARARGVRRDHARARAALRRRLHRAPADRARPGRRRGRRRGRVYLPAEDLARFGCTEHDLAARVASPAVRAASSSTSATAPVSCSRSGADAGGYAARAAAARGRRLTRRRPR